jgi:hypothetical protein
MAEVTPATITYEIPSEGEDEPIQRKIRFHAVMSEGHGASTNITKFPVQAGFEVSNHAIVQNRKITLEGLITNTVIFKAEHDFFISNSNNQKAVFAELEYLVNGAIVCDVVTNLGNYKKVVFNRFNTKQAAGSVDSMAFTLSGEELQVKTINNRTAPKELAFIEVKSSETQKKRDQLARAGLAASASAKYFEAKGRLGEDFSVVSTNDVGEQVKTTYITTGSNPVTGTYAYDVHVEAIPIAGGSIDETQFDIWSLASDAITSASNCLVQGAIQVAADEISAELDTAIGKLKKSAYGAYYETITLGGNLQPFVAMGVDCFLSEVEGIAKSAADLVIAEGELPGSTSLPGYGDAAGGAAAIGDAIKSGGSSSLVNATFTKVVG